MGEFGGRACGAVHGVGHVDQGVGGLGEDRASLLHLVPVETDDQWLRGGVAEDLEVLLCTKCMELNVVQWKVRVMALRERTVDFFGWDLSDVRESRTVTYWVRR